VRGRGHAEGSRRSQTFLRKLNIEPERSGDERAGNIRSSRDPMKFRVAPAETVGELHRDEQERTGSGQSMWQQLPSEGLVVAPHGSVGVHEKAFVVEEDIGRHHAYEREHEILRVQPGDALNGHACSRHLTRVLGLRRCGGITMHEGLSRPLELSAKRTLSCTSFYSSLLRSSEQRNRRRLCPSRKALRGLFLSV